MLLEIIKPIHATNDARCQRDGVNQVHRNLIIRKHVRDDMLVVDNSNEEQERHHGLVVEIFAIF